MNISRGEVIRVNLNPTQGRALKDTPSDKQKGNARPCLVLSNTKYNQKRKGIIVVTPLTSTVKPKVKMMIPIPSGYKAKGSVVAEQIRTLDLNSRWWESTNEILPQEFVDRVVEIFNLIIN